MFLCFALLDSFSVVLRSSRPVPFSRFHLFHSRTWFHVFHSRFRRYRGRHVPFSCFAQTQLAFGDTIGVGSRFHFLRTRTRFQRYRGRQIPFSCFPFPDMFSAVPRAPNPIFIFFAYSFSAVPRASGHVFMFCAPRIIFGGAEVVGSLFHVFHSRTRFRRYRGCQVPFSCFGLPDSFSAVPRALGHVFMLCEHRLVFDGTEGVGSRFHVLRSRTHFQRYRRRRVPFSCLRSRTHFRRYRGRPFQF
jgi:hypothetical protein